MVEKVIMSSEMDIFRQMSDEEVEQLMAEMKCLRSDNEIMKRLLSTIEKINDLLTKGLNKSDLNPYFDTKVKTKINVLNNKYKELKSEFNSSLSQRSALNDNMIVIKDEDIDHCLSGRQSDQLDSECDEEFSQQIVSQMTRSSGKPNIVYIDIESIDKTCGDVEEVDEDEEDNEQTVYTCEYSDLKTGLLCLKKLKTLKALSNHALGHSGQRPWFCDYDNCDYKATQRCHLIGHIRKSHTGRFQFTCDWPGCDFRGPSRYNITRHKRIHTGEKPYKCDWPGCEFSSPNNKIADHKRTHTGEKPYVCSWVGCESKFSRPFTLRNHERTHTGEKPFVCDYPNCDYKSSQQTPLAKHKRKHHILTNVSTEEIIIAENVVISDQ